MQVTKARVDEVERAEVPSVQDVGLLERSTHLSSLRDALRTVRDEGRGLLVLLAGEAGVGKTALVQQFCDEVGPPQQVFWGACDPLFTPRPLGPFIDIAQRETGGRLTNLLEVAKPHEVAAAIVREARAQAGTVLVLEDVHWADEASLDVLSLLGRRIESESLPPHRRLALHRRALGALEAPPAGTPDLARLAHHAEAAGDAEAVLRFAPAAAEEAASIGAHREAAAQLARALRFAQGLPAGARAGLLERLSYESYLTDQSEEAVVALERAVECRREVGDQLGEGAALSSLSRRLWCAGRITDAETAGSEAVRLLEGLPPGRELALAYGTLGQMSMNAERLDETIDWGTRALDMADRLGETGILVHSLNNVGTMQLLAGMPEGLEKLERSLALAEREGMDEDAGRALLNLGWVMTRMRAYELAPKIDQGIEACAERGLERWTLYLMAYRARCKLDVGRWDEAAEEAAHILRSIQSAPLLRILALSVLGLVRARRGDPEQRPPLDEALALAERQDTLQYLAPVAEARAEAAWLGGRSPLVEEATRSALETATARRAPWVVGELAWLRRLAGVSEEVPGVTGPYALQLAGDASAAAEAWARLGCPYDAALALVTSEDDDLLRQALSAFQRLDAGPAAAIVARRLRERGVRGVPRGPRSETRKNPANLTRRETQVLALVSQGSGNAEIAALLFLSEKTVHHHVSAILRKLGVTSRGQASAAAARLGLVP